MSNADTRDVLASLTVEQLQAVREIIEAAPPTAYPDTISAVLATTVHDAIERRFEVEKLTKAAMEAVFAATNTHPSPSLVEIIVASVWDQVNTAQNPDGHDHDGLLPGNDAPTDTSTTITDITDKDYLQELQIEADKPETSEDVRERGVPTDMEQAIAVAIPDYDTTQIDYREWRKRHGYTDEREADDNPPIAVSPQFGAHRAPETATPLRTAESVADDPSTAE